MIMLNKGRQKNLIFSNVDMFVWMSDSIIHLPTLILTCLWTSANESPMDLPWRFHKKTADIKVDPDSCGRDVAFA